MRKILTSVLSVAGLLAVVLALASSPASAAKEVVTIQTPATGEAGVYTVSWETQGGCDPGSGTSGASGSVTLTVADADGAGAATTGPQQETGVVTDDVCNYSWSATFVNAAGADCSVTGTGDGGALAVTTGVLSITGGTGTACTSPATIYVTVKAPGTNLGDCIVAPDDDGGFTDAACGTESADNTGGFRKATADDVTHAASAGAASATTFTITATPKPPTAGGDVPEGCNGGSADTEADQDNNNLQKAEVKVVNATRTGANCEYTVTAALPAGFVAGGGEERSTANQSDVDPGVVTDGRDGQSGTPDDDVPFGTANLMVSIASVKVYLVQNVIGDADGASAEYEYKAPCGAPGLPGALTKTPASGGITTVAGKTVVELRTGRYNVSGALPNGTAEDGEPATALNDKGQACEATIAVSGVPAHCSVSSNSPASLATDGDSVIIEVTVDCSPPPAPEPPAEEPMDDGADGMDGEMDGEDMSGGMDDGAEDMSGDDMDGGMDDMGPPADTPTG